VNLHRYTHNAREERAFRRIFTEFIKARIRQRRDDAMAALKLKGVTGDLDVDAELGRISR